MPASRSDSVFVSDLVSLSSSLAGLQHKADLMSAFALLFDLAISAGLILSRSVATPAARAVHNLSLTQATLSQQPLCTHRLLVLLTSSTMKGTIPGHPHPDGVPLQLLGGRTPPAPCLEFFVVDSYRCQLAGPTPTSLTGSNSNGLPPSFQGCLPHLGRHINRWVPLPGSLTPNHCGSVQALRTLWDLRWHRENKAVAEHSQSKLRATSAVPSSVHKIPFPITYIRSPEAFLRMRSSQHSTRSFST